ncbi:hypothetical protein DA391_08755 [Yersinia massiliensis]|uniref:MFS transporter n=1 Tax=Yersinia massiliensis TaxID=419257 RepID=A0ABM6USA5_9GAMM|nr:hypothetical protein DA391_08755 [Yersinia massiliensis]
MTPLEPPRLRTDCLTALLGGVGLVIGSVDMRLAITLALMPQPPMGSQARDPLGAPALAHVSLACFAGSLTYRFG